MRDFSPTSAPAFTFSEYTENIQQSSRFLFYTHDGLGLGHVRRNLTVAGALTGLDQDASVLVVTSAGEVESLGVPPRVGLLKLPGLSECEDDAAGRLELPWSDVRALRERVLAAAAETFRPEVVLVDRHPLGAAGDLGPALEIARAAGARVVLGLLDALDERSAADVEWRARGVFARISEHYDRVLVYGQPDVLDPVSDHGFPEDVAAITSFCGYVVSTIQPERQHVHSDDAPFFRRSGRPHVLATTGGGEDGLQLLATFVEAAAEAGWRATIVAGPQCPPQSAEWLRALAAEERVSFRHFVPGLPSEFASLDALVCMGGYNTLAEAAASRVPTVCVPRLESRHEQLVRARAFAARGLLRLVEPDRLTPSVLRDEVEQALSATTEGRAARALDLGGGKRAAFDLLELAAQRSARSVSAGLFVG